LIVKSLIDHIARIEKEPSAAPSSFAPKEPIPVEQEVEVQRQREELGVSAFKKWLKTWKSTSELKKRKIELKRYAQRGEQIQNGNGQELEQSPSAEDARNRQIRDRFLPCHYFDYVGGTSTGGCVDH
jgi:hypothetical protein